MLIPLTKFDRQLYSFRCSFFSICMKSIVTLVHWWKQITSLTIPTGNSAQWIIISHNLRTSVSLCVHYSKKKKEEGITTWGMVLEKKCKGSMEYFMVWVCHSSSCICSIYTHYFLKLGSTLKLVLLQNWRVRLICDKCLLWRQNTCKFLLCLYSTTDCYPLDYLLDFSFQDHLQTYTEAKHWLLHGFCYYQCWYTLRQCGFSRGLYILSYKYFIQISTQKDDC